MQWWAEPGWSDVESVIWLTLITFPVSEPTGRETPFGGVGRLFGAGGIGQAPDALDDFDRLQHAGDDLSSACSLSLVAEPLFEQLGIGETDAQLIIQPVEKTR